MPLGFGRESCTGLSPSMARFSKRFHFPAFLPRRGPTTPVSPRRHGFGLFRVRSPLLTESLFIFSSYGYLDVSVPHVRLPYGMAGLQPAGLPHSDIPGSRAICASPGLFAAYHVLRRLREPRHPPSALAYFLFSGHISVIRIDISSACSCYFILRCPSCQRSSFPRGMRGE